MLTLPNSSIRALAWLLLAAAAPLVGLHFVHLTADFPNHSAWMDWSKYTDEGWYGDAAIRFFEVGRWYVPGDFNPAAALPVWPLLEALLFRFTGVSLAAARALTVSVFVATLTASWLLIWRAGRARGTGNTSMLAASAAVLLLAASPFCFVFTRLAILEPLLVLLMLLALLAAQSARVGAEAPGNWKQLALETLRLNLPATIALGVLLPLMILTKTTAIFLFPAIAFALLAALRYRLRSFAAIAVPAGALAALLWGGYFLLLVRPHFLLDYRYLFSANAYTGITRANAVKVLTDTVKDGSWMGPRLYPVAIAAVLLTLAMALLQPRWLLRRPLAVTLMLWAAGYASFLAYHNNLQPRYYLVVAVPLTLLIPVFLDEMLLPLCRSLPALVGAVAASAAVVLAIAIPEAHQTVHFVRHPEYTLLHAADGVAQYIRDDHAHDPSHNSLLLSISGSDISLMTGLPSICDDFGTLELADRVRLYRPGWYAAWNEIDDDKMDAMTPLFHIERVAAFPAMDDIDRNLLILYRLDSTLVTPPTKGRRKPTPRQLKTRVGQQPSTTQLEH